MHSPVDISSVSFSPDRATAIVVLCLSSRDCELILKLLFLCVDLFSDIVFFEVLIFTWVIQRTLTMKYHLNFSINFVKLVLYQNSKTAIPVRPLQLNEVNLGLNTFLYS